VLNAGHRVRGVVALGVGTDFKRRSDDPSDPGALAPRSRRNVFVASAGGHPAERSARKTGQEAEGDDDDDAAATSRRQAGQFMGLGVAIQGRHSFDQCPD
jgi:hypothetical protein